MEQFLKTTILIVFSMAIGISYFRYCVAISGELMNMMLRGRDSWEKGGDCKDQNAWPLTYLVADHRLQYKDIERQMEGNGLENTQNSVNV